MSSHVRSQKQSVLKQNEEPLRDPVPPSLDPVNAVLQATAPCQSQLALLTFMPVSIAAVGRSCMNGSHQEKLAMLIAAVGRPCMNGSHQEKLAMLIAALQHA